MTQGIYNSLAAGVRSFEGMDVVANNLANASTPGFKAQRPVFKVVSPDEAVGADPRAANLAESLLTLEGVGHDLSLGALQQTGEATDLALQSDGFFVVGDGSAAPRYTRDGTLTMGADGVLLHQSGRPMLGEGDRPIRLEPGAFRVATDGSVMQGEQLVGRLQVVRFDDPQALTREGANLFAAGGAVAQVVDDPQVLQGALEQSNVDPLRELVTLIQLSRFHEAYTKVLDSLDQAESQLNNRVGKTSG